jgi:cytochrome P450
VRAPDEASAPTRPYDRDVPNLPDGPGPSRLLNTIKWQRQPTQMMSGCRERYGDVWTLRLVGGSDFVVLSDVDLLQQVFSADPAVLHTGVSTVGKPLMGERSVIILDEEEHTTMRALLRPSFRSEHVQQYRSIAADICRTELARWPTNEPRPLLPLMEAITLGVIMHAIFGVTQPERQAELHSLIGAVVGWGGSPLNMARLHTSQRKGKKPPRSFVKPRDALDVAIFRVIEEARRDPDLDSRDDILATLLRARYEDGREMTDREVRDTLVTLLIQGHASTADCLSWAMERLMRSPDAYERLREEAATDAEDYLDAVVKETLRIRPPIPMGTRLVTRAYQLGECNLPPGVLIAICIYLVHHRPDLYPEPDQFRPERFLDTPVDNTRWMPFGGGPRGCLGASFALHEVKTILRTLMRAAEFAPAEQSDEAIIRRRIGFSPSRGAAAVVRTVEN